MTDGLGGFIGLYLRGESECYHVEREHWNELTVAFQQHVERSIDKVLHLSLMTGAELIVAASDVGSIVLSTPASREVARARQAAVDSDGGSFC